MKDKEIQLRRKIITAAQDLSKSPVDEIVVLLERFEN